MTSGRKDEGEAVIAKVHRWLHLARTDPETRRKMVPICAGFTTTQRQLFGCAQKIFDAIVDAKANASLTNSIVNEVRGSRNEP